MTRPEAYAWLKNILNSLQDVHIAEMDIMQCEEVIKICTI